MPIKRVKSASKRARKKVRPRRRRSPAQKEREAEIALAAFAHEIRTSLTGILAFGELLVTSGLDEREARWAAGVKSTAEHLASLIGVIVDAAKAGSTGLVLRREPLQLRRFAQSMAASLAARAETKGVRSGAVISGDVPERVIGDAVRLRAALENLIDNAVKFTDSGSVRLEVTGKPLAGKRLRLEFVVTDSGIGMKPAEIKRLFRPFAQASDTVARRYGGTGLGLVFAKRVAKAMGGDLTVTSNPGRGSKFCLTAVVEKTAAAAAAADSEAAPAGIKAGRVLDILCVEDNPYGRVVLNTILTELGHRADFAASAEAAIEGVTRGNYDLVLMDVMLPGIDGIETTQRIRALPHPHGGIPIIGISARTAPGDEAKARAAGMDDYAAKPVSPRLLAALISKVAGAPS